jgi:hypothetical protein
MNKRIRQLAVEAGEYVNSVYTPPVRSKTPGKIWEDGHIDWHTQFNQKFAELIAEECIAQCWTVSELESNGYVVSECSKRIRKHFGVEE